MSRGARWQDEAICGDTDPDVFFSHSPQRQQRLIQTYCNHCPVRDPCLAAALADPPCDDRGVRGGTTRTQRQRIRREQPAAATADQAQPEHPPVKETTTVHTAPAPVPTQATPADPEPEPEGLSAQEYADIVLRDLGDLVDLLDWADGHTDAAIRKHAVRARESLIALYERSQADAELERIARERAQLEQRLAELNTRAQQIAPTAARTSKTRDYDPRKVREWAAANGYEVAPRGQVPSDVVAAWRQANASRLGTQ